MEQEPQEKLEDKPHKESILSKLVVLFGLFVLSKDLFRAYEAFQSGASFYQILSILFPFILAIIVAFTIISFLQFYESKSTKEGESEPNSSKQQQADMVILGIDLDEKDSGHMDEGNTHLLSQALRRDPDAIVVKATKGTDENLYKMVQTAFESGHPVTLVSNRESAPEQTSWI